MDLEVRHLELVAAVADVGSLTRAGDRLHLTQSALSHQLRDIEERLGAALFLRIGKRLVLTPAGERLLESARDILDRLRQAEDAIRHLGQERAGVLRITTECTTCYHWLPPLLTTYRRRFPAVEVRIDVEATSRPVQRLLDGAIDLALMSTPVRDRRLASRPVFTDQVVVIVSPQHRLAARRRVALTDLRDETVLIYPPRQESLFLQNVLMSGRCRAGADSGSEADRGDHRDGEGESRDQRARPLGGAAVSRFRRRGGAAPSAARPAAALVGRHAEGPGAGPITWRRSSICSREAARRSARGRG